MSGAERGCEEQLHIVLLEQIIGLVLQASFKPMIAGDAEAENVLVIKGRLPSVPHIVADMVDFSKWK
jgi:hypothetical protein